MLKRYFMVPCLVAVLILTAACNIGRPWGERQPAPAALQAEREGEVHRTGESAGGVPPGSPGRPGKNAGEAEGVRQPGVAPGTGLGGGGVSRTERGNGEPGGGGAGEGASKVNPAGQAEIEEKYLARLKSLAGEYEQEILALYQRAEQELKAMSGADPQARAAVAAEYYAAGRALESECDARFYSLLAAFERELEAGGYPLDKAREARVVYESTKQKRSAELIQRAISSYSGSKAK